MRGRAIRCERAVLPRKNVAARSRDTLLRFGLIAEACSAEIAGHPDISRPCCVALPRAGGARSHLFDCNFFVRPYGRTERPRGAGLIGKIFVPGGEIENGAPDRLTLCQRKRHKDLRRPNFAQSRRLFLLAARSRRSNVLLGIFAYAGSSGL
jgi:hypothetical protein